MGTSASSSKDNHALAKSDSPPKLPKSTSRKFQSYHLPFARKRNGFSKLKRRFFGRKKPKPGTYERTLALLSTGCEPNSGSVPDPTAPIVYERRPSIDNIPNVRGLDYKLYYRTWDNDFLLTRSPPSHFSLADNGGLLAIAHAVGDGDDESTCDAVSLPDEQLMRRSNIVTDPYSEVIRRAVIEKPVKLANRSSPAFREGAEPPVLEQTKDLKQIVGDDKNAERVNLSPKIATDATKQSSLSPRIAKSGKLPGRSPSILKKSSSRKVGELKSKEDLSTPISMGTIDSKAETVREVTVLTDDRVMANTVFPSPDLPDLETSPKPLSSTAPSDGTESNPIVIALSIPLASVPEVQVLTKSQVTSDPSASKVGDEVVDPKISVSNATEDEGETLLRDIAEKEQRLKDKLSQVQNMLVNSVKASAELQDSVSNSSGERSGSVDDDGAEDRALGGSQSSDAIASVDSPWEDIDQPDALGNAADKEVNEKSSETVAADSNVHTGIRVQMKSSEQLNILSEVVANVRQSSSPSLSGDGRESRSSSDDYNFSSRLQSPRVSREIRLKLVHDLMTNLEVDLGDFQEFLTLNARLDEKYELLPIETFFRENINVDVTFDDLSRCFRVIAKYGLNLLKPESLRPKFWNKIVAMSSNDSPSHWLSIKGSKEILFKLGYREVGMSLMYAVAFKLERLVTAHWVVELLLAAYELNAYSLKSHPNSALFRVHDYLSDNGDRRLEKDDEHKPPLDSRNTPEPIYENYTRAALLFNSDGGAESEEMFGRRTVVPWLSDKENRGSKEAVPMAAPVTSAAIQCGLCGSSSPAVRCEKCSNQIFCLSCDDMYHRHPKRHDHTRKVVHAPALPPPRPPKVVDPTKIPVPPPRRRKSQRSNPPSPVFGRKQFEQKPELPKKQFPLKFGSLKRFMPGGLSGRPPTGPTKDPQSRFPSGPHPSSGYHGMAQDAFQHNDEFSNRPSDTAQFGSWRNGSFRSEGQPSVRRNVGRHQYYYDGQSNQADLSSSDADEEIRSGQGSGGSFRGSASRGGGDDWSDGAMPPPPLPPPYGGMSARPPNMIDMQMYPNNPNASLSRRNTMMTGTLGRSSPFMMGRIGPANYMQMSNSVCDLSHPMMAGYPLPQVQSMADLHRGNMEGIPLVAAAPCGCRPNWIGPDAYGMWLPPMRCMMHSSQANVYPMARHQSGYHPGPPENMFNQPHFGAMYPPPPFATATATAQSPKPTSNNPAEIISSPSASLERRSSPAPSARSSGSRCKPRQIGDGNVATAREGGNRELRSRKTAYRQKAADIGSSSDEEEEEKEEELEEQDDYFSAGTSDDHNDGQRHQQRLADGTWECEHCTFINPIGSRICSVCCKTATAILMATKPFADKHRTREDQSTLSPPSTSQNAEVASVGGKNVRSRPKLVASSKDDGVYEDLSDVKLTTTVANSDDDVKVLSELMERGLNLSETKQRPSTTTITTSSSPSLKAKWMNDVSTATQKSTPPVDLARSKEFSEKSVAADVPSPKMIIAEDKKTFGDVYTQVEMKTLRNTMQTTFTDGVSVGSRNVTSTGTSPPPQSISTQTPNECLWAGTDPVPAPTAVPVSMPATPLQRTSSRVSLAGTLNETTSFGAPPTSSVLKRAASLYFPHGSGGGSSGFGEPSPYTGSAGYMYRTGSRTSLMSDHPFGYSSSPPSRDASPPRGFLSRRDSERAYPGYSRFGHSEDRGFLPRSGSRKDYYLSLEELVERRRHETMRTQGLELVRLLREAEQHNFTADDLQVALNHCGSQNPVQWLHDNWRNMVDTVATLSTNFGRDKKENDIGIVSTGEAKEALRIHKGNIWAAVTECVEQRQRKFTDLQNRGNFAREEVLDALTSNSGSVETAFDDLNKANLKPFLMRIWGPPAGVDNEAGSVNAPFRFSSQNRSNTTVVANKENPYEKYSRKGSRDQSRDTEDAVMLIVASEVADVSASQPTSEEVDVKNEELQQQKDEVEGDEEEVEEDLEEEDVNEELEEEMEGEEENSEIAESVDTAASAKDEEFYDTIASSPVIDDTLPHSQPSTSVKELVPNAGLPSDPAVTIPKSGSASSAVSREGSQEPPPLSESPSNVLEEIVAPTTVFKEYESLTSEFSRRVRQLLAEGKVATFEKAKVVVQLLDREFDESDAISAANECGNVYMAVSFLQQDCELCVGKFPVAEMVSMLFCEHRCCRNCAKDYFTLKIKERTIMEAVCPFCNEPDLNMDSIAAEYFNNLDIMLKNLVSRDVHELFQCKLRDRALMSDPNFHWCAKCASGFIAEPDQRRLVCPDCRAISCARCKKMWEPQHEGISCQQFSDWKEANDPEYQAFGLEKYLAENGIDCPKCKFKYALAKGGCMHFTCCQCKFEFCSGCGKPFRLSKNCSISKYCDKLGLHAHHPRNCLFYLRDKEPEELQKLLTDNSISYNVDPPPHSQTVATDSKYIKCPVMEQKELPSGNEDAICGREVDAGNAGLCRLHYVEYLVSLVNKHQIDPLCIMDVNGLQQALRRADKPVPEQIYQELESVYHRRLVQIIQAEIPLAEA